MLPEQNFILLVNLLTACKLLIEGYYTSVTVHEPPEKPEHSQKAVLQNGVAKPYTGFMIKQFLTICSLPYAGILMI